MLGAMRGGQTTGADVTFIVHAIAATVRTLPVETDWLIGGTKQQLLVDACGRCRM
jgi:hypothetical protein